MLANGPEQISLNDVIRAVEGPVQLVHCIDHAHEADGQSATGACDLLSSCPVRSPIHRIHDKLAQFLQGVTLADLAGEGGCCGRKADAAGDQTVEFVHISG
jgi:DNA-binding IscR family transcriptional regulator